MTGAVTMVGRAGMTILSGNGVPPPETDSTAGGSAQVAGHPGAIGYVSAGADPHGVRVVRVN
jgi:hypothetical protein